MNLTRFFGVDKDFNKLNEIEKEMNLKNETHKYNLEWKIENNDVVHFIAVKKRNKKKNV